MKKVVLATSVFTFAIWLGVSSLLLAPVVEAVAQGDIVAMGLEDEKRAFRPVEFSAEVKMDETTKVSNKVDLNIVQKLERVKSDMIQVCGSRNPAAVR
jgi:hypothetical protein